METVNASKVHVDQPIAVPAPVNARWLLLCQWCLSAISPLQRPTRLHPIRACLRRAYCVDPEPCDNGSCPPGFTCADNYNPPVCLPDGSGECTQDLQCPAGEYCDLFSNTCAPGCRDDADCVGQCGDSALCTCNNNRQCVSDGSGTLGVLAGSTVTARAEPFALTMIHKQVSPAISSRSAIATRVVARFVTSRPALFSIPAHRAKAAAGMTRFKRCSLNCWVRLFWLVERKCLLLKQFSTSR